MRLLCKEMSGRQPWPCTGKLEFYRYCFHQLWPRFLCYSYFSNFVKAVHFYSFHSFWSQIMEFEDIGRSNFKLSSLGCILPFDVTDPKVKQLSKYSISLPSQYLTEISGLVLLLVLFCITIGRRGRRLPPPIRLHRTHFSPLSCTAACPLSPADK